ncbi:MAG: universal stress protein [Armatimonadota bacterium]|jgi:nucleotide-binding universal stress UspA family protein
MLRKILIANDGSAGARRTLEVAADATACYGAELHSISVEEDLPKYAAAIGEVDAAVD